MGEIAQNAVDLGETPVHPTRACVTACLPFPRTASVSVDRGAAV